jgi:hypothetical protein
MGQDVSGFLDNNAAEISVGTDIFSGLLGAFGGISGGRAAKERAAFQASILRQNATLANITADQTIEQGRAVAQERGLATAQTVGQQRASYAGRGVEVDTGSALDARLEAVRLGKMDEQEILKQAEREALGFRRRAYNFELEAQGAERSGRQAQQAGYLDASASLLTSSGRLANKWQILSERDKRKPLANFGNQRDEWDVLGR